MEKEESSETSENFCPITQQHIPENGTILYVIINSVIIIIIIIIIFFFFFFLSKFRPLACCNFTMPIYFLDAPRIF
jgi:hypothetical protein